MSRIELPQDLPRRRISVDEWHRIIAAGVFAEDEHIELIEGDIVETARQSGARAYALQELAHHLGRALGAEHRVRVRMPLTLGQRSEPAPDLAVLEAAETRTGGYPSRALLVVEVADSSLATDRRVKLPLYARHGVPEVWLVNVRHRAVEVYRDPDPSGVYGTLTTRTVGADLEPSLLAGVQIPVAALF